MLSVFSAQIWLYCQPIDFRKQIDGLVVLIADQLQMGPVSGELFIFRNRKADKIKILFWERNGFWLLYKRLEKGRFRFPVIADHEQELSSEQLSWLLSGLDILKQAPLPTVEATCFY